MKLSVLPKNAKESIYFVLMILLAIALAVLGISYAWEKVTADKTVITSDSIREEIVPVARMVTLDYNFTQVMAITEEGLFPKRYVATIDGSIPIELNVEKLECKGGFDNDNALTKLKVKMPHCAPGKISLDEDSIITYVDEGGFIVFNKATAEDASKLRAQTEKDQIAKLERSGYLAAADARAEDLITNQVRAIHGENVDIQFEYIEAPTGE